MLRWLCGLIAGVLMCGMLSATEPPALKFSKRCLMVDPNEGCAIVDVNKDGRPDIIAGTHWYAAPDFIPRPVRDIPQVLKEFYSSNGDHPYDVDGDGWVDVIAGGWLEKEITWYKNPGERGLKMGWKWEPQILAVANTRNEAFDLFDFDKCGTPEIIVSCWDKKAPQVIWKIVKGPDGKPSAEAKTIGPQGGHGYGIGDINGDGRPDLLTEMGFFEQPAKDIFAQPWKFHPEAALPHPSAPCLIVDLNGDKRNDIIWGKAHDYGLYWWEQGEPKSDGTTTWKEHEIDKSFSQVHYLVWADLDGDGQCELITGKRARAHGDGDPGGKEPECLYYYKWDRQNLKFTRFAVVAPGTGVGSGMQIRVGDLNGDGRADIVVAGKTGTWLLINEGFEK
jgi:hypothetical protein